MSKKPKVMEPKEMIQIVRECSKKVFGAWLDMLDEAMAHPPFSDDKEKVRDRPRKGPRE